MKNNTIFKNFRDKFFYGANKLNTYGLSISIIPNIRKFDYNDYSIHLQIIVFHFWLGIKI